MDTPPETPASEIDLGADAPADPFDPSNLPPDPLAGELPPGVQPGHLPGVNPSEEGDDEAPVAQVEELGAGDGEEEPELVPDEERPAEQDEDEAPVAEEPEPPTSPPAEPDPIAAEADADEPVPPPEEEPKPETPVPGSQKGESSAPSGGGSSKNGSKPASKAKKSKEKKTAKSAASSSGIRDYVILRVGGAAGDWTEAFQRDEKTPEEPTTIEARNATSALRKAYHLLADAEEKPQEYELLPIPAKLFKPKKVSGRVHKQTAIAVV